MATILLVEDDAGVRTGLKYRLRGEGFEVLEAPTSAAAWPLLPQADVVVLDWMLPDEPGVRLLERIREGPHAELPVLLLTARAAEVDRVEGLNRGADDYVTKPFSPAELVARIRALLRRTKRERLVYGALVLDLDAGRVWMADAEVPLSPREYALLAFLARHPGRVFERQALLDAVWGEDFWGTPRTVDQHIAQLREKLGSGWIETVRGRGYRFRGQG